KERKKERKKKNQWQPGLWFIGLNWKSHLGVLSLASVGPAAKQTYSSSPRRSFMGPSSSQFDVVACPRAGQVVHIWYAVLCCDKKIPYLCYAREPAAITP